MLHQRKRHVLALLKRKLKLFRVVSIQGARQTGKSFLARELLKEALPTLRYVSMDQPSLRTQAKRKPETFLLQFNENQPFVIDEVQKVPDLFDAIKAKVDLDNRPGQYVILGSTEFSKEYQIRESLTGRLGRVRLYPFNIGETLSLPPNPSTSLIPSNSSPRTSRKEILRYLERGGFPGIFYLRSEMDRHALLNDWLQLVLERDMTQIPKFLCDSDLARQIVESIAKIEDPTVTAVSSEIKVHSKVVARYIKYLSTLFILSPSNPHILGTGKPRYFLCDSGLAHHLGSPFLTQLRTWLYNEVASQHAYSGTQNITFSHYRSSRGGIIDLVVEDKQGHIVACKLLDTEFIDKRELAILESFRKKALTRGYKSVTCYALGPIGHSLTIGDVRVLPWESIV